MTTTKKPPLFALIDCNNFFVSCERVFRPELEGKPVVVLSSNDGCAVSRSNEAKQLGIPMGAPAFKYRELFERHGVVRFSANFDLYSDLSRRITDILTTVTPKLEVYSVDESFLDLSELPIQDYTAWGKSLRANVLQWTGVPVSIGIAPSKTLAKLASDRAKKIPELGGVLDLATIPLPERDRHLANFPIEDIWGVGRRLAPRLRAEGVATAAAMRDWSPQRAQQLLGIHGRQMVAELSGVSCYPLEREGKPAQTISATRTFGEDTHNAEVVEASLASFASTATFRLRRSHQLAKRASLFVCSNKHKPGYQTWSAAIDFAVPTADVSVILTDINRAFAALYNPAVSYHRAGIVLYDLIPEAALQTDLFGVVKVPKQSASKRRMEALDQINAKFGKHRIYPATESVAKSWKPRQMLRSPRYTTHWTEVPVCKIKP